MQKLRKSEFLRELDEASGKVNYANRNRVSVTDDLVSGVVSGAGLNISAMSIKGTPISFAIARLTDYTTDTDESYAAENARRAFNLLVLAEAAWEYYDEHFEAAAKAAA